MSKLNNKQKIVGGSVLLLGIITAVLMLSQPPVSQYYMPIIQNQALGCPECGRGVAWLGGGCQRIYHADLLVSQYFYSSDSHNCVSGGRAVAMVRCPECAAPRLPDVAEVLPADYDGPLLVGNEMDRADQDNLSPAEAVAFTLEVRDTWPEAKLVGPNISHDLGSPWIVEFFSLLPEGVYSAHSLHMYGSAGMSVSARIDLFCSRLAEAGHECTLPIWITEIGYQSHRPQPYATMRSWALEARADERVEVVFAFTNIDKGTSNWGLLTWPGELLTTTGQGWVDGGTMPLQADTAENEAYP